MSKAILSYFVRMMVLCIVVWSGVIRAQPLSVSPLAASCITCHPVTDDAEQAIPSLMRRPASLTQKMLLDYRQDKRSGIIMNHISKGLSVQQIEMLSIYFSKAQ